jgi:hypothetical protein
MKNNSSGGLDTPSGTNNHVRPYNISAMALQRAAAAARFPTISRGERWVLGGCISGSWVFGVEKARESLFAPAHATANWKAEKKGEVDHSAKDKVDGLA